MQSPFPPRNIGGKWALEGCIAGRTILVSSRFVHGRSPINGQKRIILVTWTVPDVCPSMKRLVAVYGLKPKNWKKDKRKVMQKDEHEGKPWRQYYTTTVVIAHDISFLFLTHPASGENFWNRFAVPALLGPILLDQILNNEWCTRIQQVSRELLCEIFRFVPLNFYPSVPQLSKRLLKLRHAVHELHFLLFRNVQPFFYRISPGIPL